MYAQCPECLTVYKLRAEPLVLGRGRVRCGSCGAEFDVLATLVDELPKQAFQTLPRQATGTQVPQLSVPALRPQAEQRELFVDFDRTLRAQRPAASAPPAPSFVRAAPRRAVPSGGLGWTLGVVVLALGLGAQLAWAYREPLLKVPRVRTLAAAACARVDCRLPVLSDRRRIALLARDVRPHPSVPNALIISATMVNQAEFAQAYPLLEITLSDLDEQRIAMRRFTPEMYVHDRDALRRGLAPGATATMSLEVEDPGKHAVAFEFRFL
jgi:predicted Zn finger-like uncharacterized protein